MKQILFVEAEKVMAARDRLLFSAILVHDTATVNIGPIRIALFGSSYVY
jgi:hypothetical protein